MIAGWTEICKGLNTDNVSKACGRLDPDEKNIIAINYVIRGNPNTPNISETGLYDLVMRSREPEATASPLRHNHAAALAGGMGTRRGE